MSKKRARALAREFHPSAFEKGTVIFSRVTFWMFCRAFMVEANNPVSIRDELLVSLFYAAQGDITKFRIRAREILQEEAER